MPRLASLLLAALPTLVAGASCVLLRPGAPPAPVRGVVLVLAPALGGDFTGQSLPTLARLRDGGRSFTSAFAPAPGAPASRAGFVGDALLSSLRSRDVAVAGLGAGAALPVEPGALDLHLPDATGEEAAARLEAWLRGVRGRFVVLVGIGGDDLDRPMPPPAAVAGVFAPTLPRIAAGDLAFADRPGGELRPAAWSEPARRRAEADVLERALASERALARLLPLVERVAPGTATIVVGDPAPDSGRHGLLDALPLFDDTLRTGLLVATPGLARPGRASARVVSTLDVGPTLLELLGVPPEPALPGRSLMPLLADPAGERRSEVLSSVPRQAGRMARSVRSLRWRYTEWPDGSRELYDHEADPRELTNLAEREEHTATIAELARAFAEPEAAPGPSASVPLARAARPRNVALVVIDDLTTRVGAWGAPVETPAIDRLVARGVRFDRAYVQVAMCSPSRVSMMTGWRPERTGVWQNEDPPRPAGALPLQELFSANGATSVSIGKIYHSPADFHWDVPETDFDEPEEHPDDVNAESPGEPAKGRGLFVAAPGGDLDQPDGQRARRAVALLDHGGTRPFFLALGLVRPHRRWIAPARYFGLYPPDAIVLEPYPDDDLRDVPAIAVKTQPQPLPGLPLAGREPPGLVRDPAVRRQAIAAYQACVTFADAQLGKLLDALDRHRLWDDTVVVLVGDNGFHLGEHGGLLRKDTLFEEALHVPLIVVAPGLRHPGAVVDTPVELLDLYPTIVELAGLVPPPGLDGRSLVPLLDEPESEGRGFAVSYRRVQPPERGWSLRTERLRYTLWPDGSEELYERRGEAPESENLAGSPAWSGEKARLRARLEALVAAPRAGR